MSKIMKMAKRERYESEEEDEDWDEEEEEEEEGEESEDLNDELEEKVVENFDPNTITVKMQKLESGLNDQKFMKINKEIELRLLMIHYCETMWMEYRTTKFMFNGARLRKGDTPRKLSMVDGDIISVGPRIKDQGVVDQRPPFWYITVCIRAHKRRDTFVRVARHEPFFCSIKRNFCDSGNGKYDSTCFFHKGHQIHDLHTPNMLRLEDGDIIDAFNFADNSSSLSFVSGLPSTLRQRQPQPQPRTFKVNPHIMKSVPYVLETQGTRSRPRETQLRNNPQVQQQMTRPRPPVAVYKTVPPYPVKKRFPY